jgi:L,D-peptidoglycan transpeptidase YkuD (ErfK/YbiS/YcfS/YnhG family)
LRFRASSLGWIEGPSIERQGCAIGRNGVVEADKKREGDGCTPAGTWPLRRVLYRADRVSRPRTVLPIAQLTIDDGWCDAPHDACYNRPVRLPHPSSAERLWRDDHLYDVIVVLGYNDDPVQAGRGSCIFWHVRDPDGMPTEGCVAMALDQLLAVLAVVEPGARLTITADL